MPELNTPKKSPQIEGLDPLMASGTMYDGEDVQGSSKRSDGGRVDGMDVVVTEDDAAEPVAKTRKKKS